MRYDCNLGINQKFNINMISRWFIAHLIEMWEERCSIFGVVAKLGMNMCAWFSLSCEWCLGGKLGIEWTWTQIWVWQWWKKAYRFRNPSTNRCSDCTCACLKSGVDTYTQTHAHTVFIIWFFVRFIFPWSERKKSVFIPQAISMCFVWMLLHFFYCLLRSCRINIRLPSFVLFSPLKK